MGKRLFLEEAHVAAPNQGEGEVSHILRVLVLFMDDCVGHHIARVLASAQECSSTVVETPRYVEIKIDDALSGHSVPDDILRLSCSSVPSRASPSLDRY